MKQKKTFKLSVFVHNHKYGKDGILSLHTEDVILNTLRHEVEWYAEVMFDKIYQASIADRTALDRYLKFTNNERCLPNGWEFCTDDEILEHTYLTFEVEFLIPDSKKDAKNLQKFTF